jgi:hypothetical protein
MPPADMIRLSSLYPALSSALALFAVVTIGCTGEREGARKGGEEGVDEPARVVTYEVRGEVLAVPDPEDPASRLLIRHEAVDGFEDIDGEVVGMDSMAMPFPLAPEASVDDVAPGDKVRFTLEVSWEGDPPYRITALEPLAPDTELTYRAARPAAEPPEEPPAEELPAEELPAEEPTPAAAEGSS